MSWEWSDSERAFYLLGERVEPDIRTRGQMLPVLYDPGADAPDEFYYMYRGASLPEHADVFNSHSIRYDVTVIPAATIGGEFVKTAGHFHPKAGKHTYPEAYEVLEGEAHYLFQSEKEAVVYEAKKGDAVIVPPDYGHVTINPGKSTLVMANLVSPDFASIYGPFKERHGAAYFELDSGWLANDRYEGIAFEARSPEPIHPNGIYGSFLEEPERFSFLNNPDEYYEVFE